MIASVQTNIIKWVVAVLLALMLVGIVVVAYCLPVKNYAVTCTKSEIIICVIERETFSRRESWQVALGAKAIATVKIQPRRRGSSRVLLYLNSSSKNVFAAEFEGSDAFVQAEAAAKTLNRAFSSLSPVSAHVVASPPVYFNWLIWGGIIFFGLFVLIIYREIFFSKSRTGSLSWPLLTPDKK